MWAILAAAFSGLRFLLTGTRAANVLEAALGIVDKQISDETQRQQIKASIVQAYFASRADWMRAGGMWTLLAFAIPTALWWAALCAYNVLWCAQCMFPQKWIIAGFPPPYDDWGRWVLLASIGALGLIHARGK